MIFNLITKAKPTHAPNVSQASRPQRPQAVRRLERLAWILSALLVLGLHGDWLVALSELPTSASPAVDEALHWQWAQDLATGRGSPELPYFRAPLYPWWLGLLNRAGVGLEGLHRSGTVLSLAALALLVGLCWRAGGRRAGLVALLLAGASATWIHYEAQLLLEHMVLFWILAATAALHASLDRGAGWRDALFGMGLGLAAITRPNALLLAPLALWMLWRRGSSRQDRGRRLVWWTLGWLPPLLLVATLNSWPGSGVLVASQGGVNLWIGTHGGADGWSATLPEVGSAWERADATGIAARELGHMPTPGEESAFYSRRAVDWALDHPRELAGQLLWKSALLLAPQESGNNTHPISIARQRSWMKGLLPWSWWLLLLPGLAGLALGFPASPELRRWVLGALGIYAASFLPFFIAGRFRIPLLGLLAIPAASWLADLWRHHRLRTRDGRRPSTVEGLILAAILALPLASGVWVAARLGPDHQRHQAGWQAFQLGNAWMRLAREDSARARFQEALILAPGLKEVRLNLGLLEMDTWPAKAESLFMAELAVDGRSAKAWNNLGALWLGRGEAQKAVEAYREALRLRPDLVDASWNLGLALATRGLQELQAEEIALARATLNELKTTPYRGRGLELLSRALMDNGFSKP